MSDTNKSAFEGGSVENEFWGSIHTYPFRVSQDPFKRLKRFLKLPKVYSRGRALSTGHGVEAEFLPQLLHIHPVELFERAFKVLPVGAAFQKLVELLRLPVQQQEARQQLAFLIKDLFAAGRIVLQRDQFGHR